MIISTVGEYEVHHSEERVIVYKGDAIIEGEERKTVLFEYEKTLNNALNWMEFLIIPSEIRKSLKNRAENLFQIMSNTPLPVIMNTLGHDPAEKQPVNHTNEIHGYSLREVWADEFADMDTSHWDMGKVKQ